MAEDSALALSDSALTLSRTTRYIKPAQILKAANALREVFTKKDGTFDTLGFARAMGTVRKDEKKVQGYFTHVTSNKDGELQLTYKKDRDSARRDAEDIPVQIEYILKNFPKIGGDHLYKAYRKRYTSGVGKAFGSSAEATQKNQAIYPDDEGEIQGGHLQELISTRSKWATPGGFPNVGSMIIDERKYPRVEFDEEGQFIYTPGNWGKGNHPLGHFDPKDTEIAGGGLAKDWTEDVTQFLIEEIYGTEEGVTGTNVENLTAADKALARDRGINIQVVAAQRDRLNQLNQQVQQLWQAAPLPETRRDIDPRTGLPPGKIGELIPKTDYDKHLATLGFSKGIGGNYSLLSSAAFDAFNNQNTLGQDSLDSSAPKLSGAKRSILEQNSVTWRKKNIPYPSKEEIRSEKFGGRIWSDKEHRFITPERNINPQQDAIDTVHDFSVAGFHWAANRYTSGAYGQFKNAFEASQNLKNRNYVGLASNLLSVELVDEEPYHGIWNIQTENLLNGGPIK